jgi:hypothetical protein
MDEKFRQPINGEKYSGAARCCTAAEPVKDD